MLNRNITIFLNRMLDDFLPPIIRDSRWFYTPLLRIVFGKQTARTLSDFKRNACVLTEEDFLGVVKQFEKITSSRETDLNRKCMDRLCKEIANTKVLEIGCGNCMLAKNLAKKNKVCAIDIAISEQLRSENPEIEFREDSCEDLSSVEDNEFDVVVITHVLEHVRNISAAIQQMRRICRKQLFIVVPCQRPYCYTPDSHLHFFPYPHSLILALNPRPDSYTCEMVGGDIYYTELQ